MFRICRFLGLPDLDLSINKHKKIEKNLFLLASWKPLTTRAGSGSGSVIQCTGLRIRYGIDPDPYQHVTDSEHCFVGLIRIRWHNTFCMNVSNKMEPHIWFSQKTSDFLSMIAFALLRTWHWGWWAWGRPLSWRQCQQCRPPRGRRPGQRGAGTRWCPTSRGTRSLR